MSNFSVVAAENDFILNGPKFGRSRPGLYPSETSVEYDEDGHHIVEGKCLRAAWYRIKKIPQDRPPNIYLAMKAIAGKAMEEATIERWKRMGMLVDNNIKFFSPEFIVSGELDAIIKDLNNPERIILEELKSYDGYPAQKEILGSKRPPVPGRPKVSHYLQAIDYAWEYKDEIDEYRIYYMDRVGGARVEFRIGTELKDGRNICWRENIDPSNQYWNYTTNKRIYYPFAIEDIHNRYRKLVDYARKDILPPCDYGYIKDEDVEFLYNKGDINKKDYEPWKKDPERNKIKHWCCNYCFWPGRCKADSIGEADNEL